MRQVDVFSLQPGMKIGHHIFNSRRELLLSAGTVLTPKYIEKLMRLGVTRVHITDNLLPDLEIKDVISRETRTAAIEQTKNILLSTKESGRLIIKPRAVYSTISDFVNQLLSHRSLMVNLTDLRTMDDYTFSHSVNVCVLALMTGITLEYDEEQLAVLGVGSLLHDLGKVEIPDNILNKPGPLTPREYSVMKKHTLYGYRLIRERGDMTEEFASIALQHHENFDGTGYPRGIKGDKFHEFAQIVAIADRFDALTANRVYRKAYPAHEAFEMCAASGNYLVSHHIVKAFLHNIAAYPSGTVVKLNTGHIAVTLDTPKGHSLFPRVRLLFDENNKPLPTPGELALAEERGIYVVKILAEEEIQFLKSINFLTT